MKISLSIVVAQCKFKWMNVLHLPDTLNQLLKCLRMGFKGINYAFWEKLFVFGNRLSLIGTYVKNGNRPAISKKFTLLRKGIEWVVRIFINCVT